MKRQLPAALAAFLLTLSGVSAQNLLQNGDFENEPNFDFGVLNGTYWSAFENGQLPGWTIVPGHLVTVHAAPGLPSGQPVINGYSVNTDGEGYNGNNADFYQDFGSVLGQRYYMSFDWESWYWGAAGTLLEVSVIDTVNNTVLFDGSYDYTSYFDIEHVSTSFLGTGNALRLEIQENAQSGYNDNKFMVDNFVVSTPETSAWVAEAIALVAMVSAGSRLRIARGGYSR